MAQQHRSGWKGYLKALGDTEGAITKAYRQGNLPSPSAIPAGRTKGEPIPAPKPPSKSDQTQVA